MEPPRKKTRYDWLEKARLAEIDREEAQSHYLRLTGWTSTCHTPGAYWMWTKTTADGKHLMANTSTAICMQQNLDSEEEPRPEDDDSEG